MANEVEKKLYPMKFIPFPETVSWGGSSLVKKYSKSFYVSDNKGHEVKLDDKIRIGESWEIADMGFRDSLVDNGWLKGNALSEVMDMYIDRIVGNVSFKHFGRQFPLLVKLIEVRGRMPLMAHPDDPTAIERYDSLGKTKFWYIVDAEPGSKVYMGFKKNVSATELYSACADGTAIELMNEIKPKRGEAFLITPGLVHCAEGGLVIAEIAESSDLDFKLCNWGMPTENDTDESLTLVEAMDFLEYGPYNQALRHTPSRDKRMLTDKLVDCPHFTVTKVNLTAPLHITGDAQDSFIVYMCVEGKASLQVTNPDNPKDVENYIISKGETILLPSEVTDFILAPMDPETILLETMIHSFTEDDPYINKDAEARIPGEEYDFLTDDSEDEDEDPDPFNPHPELKNLKVWQ